MEPIIFKQNHYTTDTIEQFKQEHKIWQIVDIIEDQLKELFEIQNAHVRKDPLFESKLQEYVRQKLEKREQIGDWIYFPWNGMFVHTVQKNDYQQLRTNRNKNLITQEEQEKLLGACIGVIGLSIGSTITTTLAYSGIGTTFKLAENDTISPTNLNRIRASMHDIGKKKLQFAAEQIYEINPYATIVRYENGIQETLLAEFCSDNKPDIIFDEMDDFEMKIKIRLAAREAKIPVVMMTNIGDNLLIDIERYDQEPTLALFNGVIGSVPEEILNNPITELDKVKYAIQIVGVDNVPTRALGSLLEIHRTLVGRPQLNGSVTSSAGIASYVVRKIILGESITSGRYLVSLPEVFSIQEQEADKRDEILDKLGPILRKP